jgi:hypothetical protein
MAGLEGPTFSSSPVASPTKPSCPTRVYRLLDQGFLVDRYIRSSVALFILSYNSIVDACFRYLDCLEIEPGESYVSSMPAVSCQSSEYRNMWPLVLTLLIVVVGLLPLLIVLFLYRKRQRLQEDQFKRRFGNLYEFFLPSYFFWEIFLLARRVILIVIMVQLQRDDALYSTASVINIIFALFQLYFNPFVKQQDNTHESIALVVLTLLTTFLTGTTRPLSVAYAVCLSLLVSKTPVQALPLAHLLSLLSKRAN